MLTAITNDRCQTYYGTSNDIKPINKYIGNGSQFIESDTSRIFLFDEQNQQWLNFEDVTTLTLLMRGLL